MLKSVTRFVQYDPKLPISPASNSSNRQSDVTIPPSGVRGIPEIALAAYRNAELHLAESQPGCGLSWNLLAGIGRIESNHANGGNTDTSGTTLAPILGPSLDGTLAGNEVVPDSTGGYVRAVGPMQFLPRTWNIYASDANADGAKDPNNVFDAALSAGEYLCAGGRDLRDPTQETRAILRYNNSMAYVSDVIRWSTAYKSGGTTPSLDVTQSIPAVEPPIEEADPRSTRTAEPPPTPPTSAPALVEPMILIPGLPPIPCGILCPPPPISPTAP